MRVITGYARGKRLITLDGDSVRPTSDRVKEAIFSSIQFDIEGRSFLDLFAGSGQMGIEALSRGATHCQFCDAAAESVDIINKNLANCGLAARAVVTRSDYSSFLASCASRFDFAFLDPPYDAGLLIPALEKVTRIMSDHGVIICEHPNYVELPDSIADFIKSKTYRYGKILVSLYKKEA